MCFNILRNWTMDKDRCQFFVFNGDIGDDFSDFSWYLMTLITVKTLFPKIETYFQTLIFFVNLLAGPIADRSHLFSIEI